MAESGLVKVITVVGNFENILSPHHYFKTENSVLFCFFVFALVCFVFVLIFLRNQLPSSCFELHSIHRFAGLMATQTPTATVYKEQMMWSFILR